MLAGELKSEHDQEDDGSDASDASSDAHFSVKGRGTTTTTTSSSQHLAGAWVTRYRELKRVMAEIKGFVCEYLHQPFDDTLVPDLMVIAKREGGHEEELRKIVIVLLECAIHCEKRETFVQRILTLESGSQAALMREIEQVSLNYTQLHSVVEC